MHIKRVREIERAYRFSSKKFGEIQGYTVHRVSLK
jgi:hypothetical protein